MKIGANIEIEEDRNSVFRDILKVYHSKIEGVVLEDIVLEQQISHGRGFDKNQAYLSAGYELIERILSRYHGGIELINGKPTELKKYVENIKNIVSIPKEIRLPYDNYDVNKKIDWIWGYSIIEKNYKLVPASIVFISDCIFEGNFPNLTSSGLSAQKII